MFKLLSKIFSVPKTVMPMEAFASDHELFQTGKQLESKIKKMFRGSLAIREVDAGSTAAEEMECNALGNAYYDVERFGVHFVASPKHADMLFVTGPVSRNMAEPLRRAYECAPEPKIVVAVGNEAIDGGIYKGSYAVYDGVDKVIPVHFKIPGDPPSPKVMITALLQILEVMEKKGFKKAA
ncbi:formate hydrogenlyase [Candidatus Uhrbacteria bacterium]|nr:formate hydrogenlyase [Candidatus Uhrbacteria bacterium]